MIAKQITDKMTVVELRNYVEIMTQQILKQQSMIEAQDELIKALLNLYNQESRKADAMIEMNIKASEHRGFELAMEQRYEEPEPAIESRPTKEDYIKMHEALENAGMPEPWVPILKDAKGNEV